MFSLPSPSSDLKVPIKCSETALNVKPQTVVETFDQANCNSIPDRCGVGEGGGGVGGNSIDFHLSFLTHSARQYDVT